MSEETNCKKCGKGLKPGWKLCPFCKTPVVTARLCRNCATEWEPGWQACPVCGCEETEDPAQTGTAEPLAPPPPFAPGPVPEGFVYVEGGTFMMGSPNIEKGRNNDETQHKVTVSGFYMGKYTVTQKEWQEVMGTTISQQRDLVNKKWKLKGKGDNYPMYCVNWYEAVEYCNRRSIKEGLASVYSSGSRNSVTCDWNAKGYRLPTEAEWEYAARGGNSLLENCAYAGSNTADVVAWYDFKGGETTRPVGTKTPNSLRIYDMSGNVWEWCWDWYDLYKNGLQVDPHGPVVSASSKLNRIVRGGGWGSPALDIRSANRGYTSPSRRYSFLGFRLVRGAIAH